MTMKDRRDSKASLWNSIKVGLVSLLVMVIFAYGFQITKVNLEELSSAQRQDSLIRVVRALAKPAFFEYTQSEEVVNAPFYIPCPATGTIPAEGEQLASKPYLVITPACANPGDTIQVEGFNFAGKASGPLRFVPGSDLTNVVTLGRETVVTDSQGHFVASMVLPDRQSTDLQFIRASLHVNVGLPHFTQTAHDTWDKIIETVFLALLATVFGTFLAIPLSFLAARNLMKPVKSTLISISLSALGWPIGIGVGFLIVGGVGTASTMIGSNVWINLASIIVTPVLIWLGIRWAIPQEEIALPRISIRLARMGVIILGVLVAFFGLFQLASLTKTVGTNLEEALGSFGFLGNFLFQIGNIVAILTPAIGGLAAGGALGSFLGRIGQQASEKISGRNLKTINLFLSTIAGSTILVLLGQIINWLYQVGNPLFTLWVPMGAGAFVGLLLAIFIKAKEALSIGMVIYFITRTILNALRSVEALVMAIVFVIAVGIGPFAGVLALGLHTIVSLAKLYSEQVESIMPGPLEAIQATGANRLQTIMYGVIPQIIPPYISYTMYRWDINVRMSTIIGFVGGGGIGFLLQQNINLLNYRAASAQMVAIAVVVASMDYISSVLREKTI
jgi:phosphonate ABC transporter permease subunit PhnE